MYELAVGQHDVRIAPERSDSGQVTVDIDAAIVTSCSEKDQAAPIWKKSCGFHPLTACHEVGWRYSRHAVR
ncbi:MAG TPA: hypothetical protein VK162_02930 [Streptosporangiaceae bacterium]|nr:hypothetical protein [Streptosporangiaceae bacterium]